MERKICYYLDEVDNILAGNLQYPITCEIDPSNYCQNRCLWCINSDYIASNRVNLDFDLYCILLKEIKECGVKSVTFTGGGEPTLNPNFTKMIREAISRKFEFGLITNGIEIEKYIDSLAAFRFVRISVDAGSPETYFKIKGTNFYNKVIKNIESLVSLRDKNKLKTVIGISFVVCDENINEIEKIQKLGNELGVSYVQVKPVISEDVESFCMNDISRENKMIITSRYSSDKITKMACHIAGLVGNVCADGKVYYCCIHRGNSDFLLGNLETESFFNIWKRRRTLSPDISACKSCRYMNYVKGYEEFSLEKYSFLRHKYFL